jgi:hypothetical protein
MEQANVERTVESFAQYIRGIITDGDHVAVAALPAKIITSLEVTEQVKDLIEVAIALYGDSFTDGMANGLYSLADDLKRRAHPEWPDLRPMIHDLRHAVPDDIHPSAGQIVHQWLTEAEMTVYPPEVLRLVGLATDKIADELRWEAEKLERLSAPEHAGKVAEFRKRAEQFDGWTKYTAPDVACSEPVR